VSPRRGRRDRRGDHGALLSSSKLRPEDSLTLLDVLPIPIGINKVDGTMHVLFAKNQPLPDYKTRTLTTSKDNQRSIMLRIYQGDSQDVDENELLGTFVFSGSAPRPRARCRSRSPSTSTPRASSTSRRATRTPASSSSRSSSLPQRRGAGLLRPSAPHVAVLEEVTRLADLADRARRGRVRANRLYPGTSAATARALANFGMSPARPRRRRRPTTSSGRGGWHPAAHDVVDGARIVGSLDEALVRRPRGRRDHRPAPSSIGPPVVEPAEVGARLFADDADHEHVVAILFGREDFGLPNDAVQRCRSLVRIATPEHASLNLGQAVMLVAYELFQEARRHGVSARGRTLGGSKTARPTAAVAAPDARDRLAPVDAAEPAVTALVEVLDRVGYTRGTPADKVRLTARGAIQTARLSVRHVEALRGMLAKVRWALDHRDD
jgi:tRNA/rRNA methyltransferase